MDEHEALLPKNKTRVVERGALKTILIAFCGAAVLAGVAVPRGSRGGGLRGAPTALKAAALKSATESGLVRDVDPSRWAIECVQPYQEVNAVVKLARGADFSNYDLINMPSGICVDGLACSFENCNASIKALTELVGNFDVQNGDVDALAQESHLPGVGIKFASETADSPTLSTQVFPKSVADVVEAVKYAKAQDMPISVKTSGHSYAGSSTLAGSVNINMRDFPKYSQKHWLNSKVLGELPAVTPCDATFLASIGHEMTPACKLALARGKNATLRVGGGELWDDAYRGVDNSNYWMIRNGFGAVKVMGGGAGTVSAAGGWMAGGGLSDGSERVYGYGVDNVLELEMVIPSGEHVKFHPSEWEESPGYLVPKTTKVVGFCNKNVAADESEWQWEECTVAVPWEDMWYAVRGGGGGSYGVVVGLTYQLHPRRFRYDITIDKQAYGSCANLTGNTWMSSPSCCEVQHAFTDFWIDLLYNSSAIGVPEEVSLGCGNTALQYPINWFKIICHDKDKSSSIEEAWATYWQSYNGLVPAGMDMDEWASSALVLGEEFKSLAAYEIIPQTKIDTEFPEGHIADSPKPLTLGTPVGWSALVPVDFFLQKNEAVHLMTAQADFHTAGGHVGKLHDQMTALSDIYRISGAQHLAITLAAPLFPKVTAFHPSAPGDKILGGTEYNHITRNEFGPLKSNHSKLCPVTLTNAEKEEQCVSLQESVWGTDGLARLEAIKAKIDPQGLFQCQKCVGFKGPVRDQ